MRKLIFGILGLAMLVLSCSRVEDESLPSLNQSNDDIIAGQYVVVMKSSAVKSMPAEGYDKRVAIVREEAVKLVAKYEISKDAIQLTYGTAIAGFSAKLSDLELSKLRKDENIDYILPDRIYTLGVTITGKPTPQPPAETIPYGINRVGYGSGVGKTAWIIDTGVDMDHPDLNVSATKGYDFINNDNIPDDDNGHGSHCAGTVAAIDNSIGVVGVAAGATIVPVKVLNRRGSGAYSVIIAGIDFVAANAKAGDAANMSLGGSVYQPIDDAVLAASQKGIFFALAAGNESDDANNHSPARVNGANIWTISAMDSNDNFAYFSNYGNPPVDYCMPGVSIYSTYKGGGYTTMSGTSMAAPHMCGVLLMTGGKPTTSGYVKNDPDGKPDPIGHI